MKFTRFFQFTLNRGFKISILKRIQSFSFKWVVMTKNENIQANKNRIIPVIRQLFDSDMVT